MKKILIAPNSFKGCASSVEAAQLISGAVNEYPNLLCDKELCPITDGGDGFLEVLKHIQKHLEKINFPLTPYYLSGTEAIVEVLYSHTEKIYFLESAKIFGLALNEDKCPNPLKYNTVNFGRLIRNILEDSCVKSNSLTKLFIGFGGSGTNDLGMGAAGEFGLKFFSKEGSELPLYPEFYPRVSKIILPQVQKELFIDIVYDVDIPLLGEKGPSLEYSIQKGASPEQARFMEEGDKNIISILSRMTDKDNLEKLNGAAGGAALGLSLFAKVNFIPAREFIINFLQLEKKIIEADAVITAEGKLDRQSFMEKGTGVIADLCKKHNKPLYIICGTYDPRYNSEFFAEIVQLSKPGESVENSMKNFRQRLPDAVNEIISKLKN